MCKISEVQVCLVHLLIKRYQEEIVGPGRTDVETYISLEGIVFYWDIMKSCRGL